MASKKRKKRRKRGGAGKRGGGVMGMRYGFQRMAKSVSGDARKKSSVVSNLIWGVLVIAALAFMVYRAR